MNQSQHKTELILFLRFAQRDYYLYRHRIKKYLINYACIYPLLHAFSFGFLQSQIYFSDSNIILGTMLFTGNFLLVVVLLTYKLSIELLFDIEGDRYIDYQLTILRPQLILLERILFTSVFSFFILLPYFPIAKILLGSYFAIAQISWIKLIIILYASCLMTAAYNHLAAALLPSTDEIGYLWLRVNIPLFTIGGFWIPWYAMNKFSPILGAISLLNPFLYITEGIRQAILNQEQFLSLTTCLFMLIFFSVIFTGITFIVFKKKMDHI